MNYLNLDDFPEEHSDEVGAAVCFLMFGWKPAQPFSGPVQRWIDEKTAAPNEPSANAMRAIDAARRAEDGP
jgi:hypothetical protein